ncbi:MAG: hypothetical protein IKK21_05355 [Clostridia bacterium]|nr:hypothetical protein [Clostridia bacterium]
MRSWIVRIAALLVLAGFLATAAMAEDAGYSNRILISYDMGTAGFGTVYDFVDAEVYVFRDKTVRMITSVPEETVLAEFTLTDEEYACFEHLAEPARILGLYIDPNETVIDGSISHVRLYGPNDEIVVEKSGYTSSLTELGKLRRSLQEVLEPYGLRQRLESYRQHLRDEKALD